MSTYLVTFRGPAMEARDVRAGELAYDQHSKEFEASSEDEARAWGERWCEEAGEGLEVFDVEITYDG